MTKISLRISQSYSWVMKYLPSTASAGPVPRTGLLRRAEKVCEVFVTLDRNLEFQQNIKALPFGVVVVRSKSNRMADLRPHIASVLLAVNRVAPGQVEHAGA